MHENVGGAEIELTEKDLQDLADVLAKQPVQGERYNAEMMKTVNR